MGINTTPTNYKSFTFDGRSSREFGVYTTGNGVFNAPERAVEMISIPARNGDYALDLGHFENIEVTYRCGIVADNETDFAEAVSDFRNWLCSRRGYCRLQDEYNTDEFRMGIFKNVVNVDHDGLQTGEFDVTFDCKPQRWLTSGETETEITSGDSITNPTLFASSPLLEVEGYGTIDLGGQDIEINNDVMGNVLLVEQKERPAQSIQATFATDLLNNNDTFIVDASFQMLYKKTSSGMEVTSIVLTSTSGCDATVVGMNAVYVEMNSATFTKGTSATASCSATYTVSGNNIPTQSRTLSCSVQYDGDNVLTFTNSGAGIGNLPYVRRIKWNDIYGDSTASVLGHPTYIDCDIGECYMIKNNEVISLNQYIDLGSDLPTLPPGATTVNYDNTITDLKIAPRWWKV